MESKLTILIICEGENTEPLFFNSIRDRIKDGKIDMGDIEITLRPEPKIDDTEVEEANEHRAYKRKKRETKKVQDEPRPVSGIPPLKWVEEGHRELKDGTFNEIWAVFDKDQHPKAKEAFKLAEKDVDGKYVNIAFSSVCFEYYLLLHFEKIYYDFEKSECHEKCKKTNKNIYFQCGTHIHPKDCDGCFCINGYAKKNNYWKESKNDSSVYDLIEPHLDRGFANAAWIRFVSDKLDKNKPIYLRNPYLTVDKLVKRLVGETKEWRFISLDEVITINNDLEFSVYNNWTIKLKNISTRTILIPINSFEILCFKPNKIEQKGDRTILSQGAEEIIQISEWDISEYQTIIFNYENNRILFDFFKDYKKIKYSNLIKKLIKLSSKELLELRRILFGNDKKINITMENTITSGNLDAKNFRKQVDGKEVNLFILKNNNGMEVSVINFGAKIVSVYVPDKNGKMTDVVLGKSSIDDYMNDREPYFGAVCGRTAGRIAGGRFELDGKEYRLAINNGPNNLHGGIKGFHAVVWDAEQTDASTLKLSYLSKDGEEGFPGNLSATVIYRLTGGNALEINYQVTTDKTTIHNLTNHTYFNLSGEGDPYIGDHKLQINAASYLPTSEVAIPFGKPEKVEGTPFDFRTPHTIGERIEERNTQLIYGNGYDHPFDLGKKDNALTLCAKAVSPKTGIALEILSTEPCIVLYTGNYLDGSFPGKNGHHYPKRSAFCLETQHFPDSIHHPEYLATVLKPGETYESQTVFKFSVTRNF